MGGVFHIYFGKILIEIQVYHVQRVCVRKYDDTRLSVVNYFVLVSGSKPVKSFKWHDFSIFIYIIYVTICRDCMSSNLCTSFYAKM